MKKYDNKNPNAFIPQIMTPPTHAEPELNRAELRIDLFNATSEITRLKAELAECRDIIFSDGIIIDNQHKQLAQANEKLKVFEAKGFIMECDCKDKDCKQLTRLKAELTKVELQYHKQLRTARAEFEKQLAEKDLIIGRQAAEIDSIYKQMEYYKHIRKIGEYPGWCKTSTPIIFYKEVDNNER